MNSLNQRKVVSLRMCPQLKQRVYTFLGSRLCISSYSLHTEYTLSFALRDLLLEGVLSYEKELGLCSDSNQHQVRSFSKKRSVESKEKYSVLLSCSMPAWLVNRVSGVAAALKFNRAEAFRAVLQRGLSSIQ